MSVRVNGVEITLLKHDAFLLRSGDVAVAIDPYQLKKKRNEADLVLITHDHFDHCEQSSVDLVAKPGAVIVAPKSAAAKLTGEVKVVQAGDQVTEKGVTVRVVPAYNVRADRQNFHPKGYDGVGYLIHLGGLVIYHAGDTDVIPEMETLGPVDLALLPVSGTYVMDAREAAEAVQKIRPKRVIPMHWGAIVGSRADAVEFQKLVGDQAEVILLDPEE
ncbi:MAG: MBL fold metallo-hydrolase [Armatimonadetes bacterium]|nr:MBL fold metallo-hydrolase [Armatimonadota bacterium]MDW8122071.1 MBL fold metallo-hydrolase [Armatimonadota bacterium]